MLETHWIGSQAKVCIYYVIVRRKRKLDSKGEGRRGDGTKMKEIIRRENKKYTNSFHLWSADTV